MRVRVRIDSLFHTYLISVSASMETQVNGENYLTRVDDVRQRQSRPRCQTIRHVPGRTQVRSLLEVVRLAPHHTTGGCPEE